MIRLSVVVITLNEEKNLGRCLGSVAGIADEIVVVDSYSTDKTEVIARSFGARFIQNKFEGYVKQKSFAVEQAKYDYILSLDADEVLSDELKKSIIKAKTTIHADGYTMNRLTNYAGKWVKHCGWYPDKKMRLFNRSQGSWQGLIIHEEFKLFKGRETGHLEGDLLHYSFHSVEEHKKQSGKFTTLGAQADFIKGKKAPLYKLWLAPAFKFFQSYFLKLGFLDGKTGLTICRISAQATHQKYDKLRKLYREKK